MKDKKKERKRKLIFYNTTRILESKSILFNTYSCPVTMWTTAEVFYLLRAECPLTRACIFVTPCLCRWYSDRCLCPLHTAWITVAARRRRSFVQYRRHDAQQPGQGKRLVIQLERSRKHFNCKSSKNLHGVSGLPGSRWLLFSCR